MCVVGMRVCVRGGYARVCVVCACVRAYIGVCALVGRGVSVGE